MNLVDATVTKITTPPTEVKDNSWAKGMWYVEYEYNCYGSISTDKRYFKTKEEADAWKVGRVFQT